MALYKCLLIKAIIAKPMKHVYNKNMNFWQIFKTLCFVDENDPADNGRLSTD